MTDLIKALREQGHAESKTEYWTGWNDALNAVSASLRQSDAHRSGYSEGLNAALDQMPLHETHVCRECGAVITIPYVKPETLAEKVDREFR